MFESEEDVNVDGKARDYKKIIDDPGVTSRLSNFSGQLFADIKKVLLNKFNVCSEFRCLDKVADNIQTAFEYYQYCVVMKNDKYGNLGLYCFPKSKDGYKFDLSKIEDIVFLKDIRSEVCCIDVISIVPVVSDNSRIVYKIDSNNNLFKSCPVNFDAANLEVTGSVDLIGSYVFDEVNYLLAVSPFSKKGYLIKHFYDDELFSK